MMRAKVAEEQRQQNAHNLVAAGRIVLLVKNGLWVGVSVRAHLWSSPCLPWFKVRNLRLAGSGSPDRRFKLTPKPPHCPTLPRGHTIEIE
jgi:hypothetical protein